MILFLLVELLLLAGCAFLWYIGPEMFSVGYVVFHSYPIFVGLLAFLRANWARYKRTKPLMKALVLLIPFALWVAGVLYIDSLYSLRTKGLPYLSDLRISKEKNLIEMLNNLELSFEDKINFKTISSLNEKDSYREISFRQGITTIGMALSQF